MNDSFTNINYVKKIEDINSDNNIGVTKPLMHAKGFLMNEMLETF